ncbi:uncharacterized protein LOC114961256 [Acropora millepora]|uniref:uncharacterized protein LOC114961256 n=1 Tax=Acropora millepora TaxID=45264 RepID=UPI001CF226CA|nr:uncharacterized protein LOC114961256 [Acropora millepora]
MNEGYYDLIVTLPTVLFMIIIPFAGCICYLKITNFGPLVATYTFPNIIQKKKNANGTVSWQVRDVEIEDGTKLLSRITSGVCLLFGTLIVSILSMFFQLLLLEVSYDCDPDETSKDCFEFKFWDTWRFSNAPINCTSKAVIDDSVEIICYEIVYNFGTAAGASYGVFKISNGAMELLATLILMRKTTRFVSVVQTVLLLAVLGFVGVIIGVQASSWRVYLETTNFTYIYQALGTLLLAFQFMFLVPWKDLIKKINEERSTRGQELRLDNIVIQ